MIPSRVLALSLLLAACGDNLAQDTSDAPTQDAPHMTWREAYAIFIDAQCLAGERCLPVEFADTYDSQAACVFGELAHWCLGAEGFCASTYPATRVELLETCHAEMAVLECASQYAPDSCQRALK